MHRLIVLTLIGAAALCPISPVFGRSMEAGDAAAVARAAPAVVSISTWKLMTPDQASDVHRRIKAYGSGFIVDPSGIIVTNKHVIDGAFDIKAQLQDGSVVPASLIGASPLVDLAVLKVDVGHPLPSLEWGDSDALRVGDPVLTIGNALGWGTSVSAGIISGLNRNLMDSPFDNYIQTDATINHGNSGGPLVDREGKVVGVDTALYNPASNGGFIGIGFAIPGRSAHFVAMQILEPNHPAPGWLGFSLQDLTSQLAMALGVQHAAAGAIVASVDPSGPASQASLQPGDVLEQLDGKPVVDARALMRAVAQMPAGQSVHVTIWRAGKEQKVTATVAAWPKFMPRGGVVTGQAAAKMMEMEPHPGVKLAAITEADRKQYGLSAAQTGVLITQVEPDCEASDFGVVPGDVVTAVADNRPVATPDDVWGAVKTAYQQHQAYLAVLIKTKAGAQWLPISIGR